MINLNGKNALVTGGANGIGKGIAIVLAAQGANVVVSDVDLESAQLVASEIRKSGNRSNSIFLDVTSKDSAQSVASDLIDRLGTIDILVNNAGVVGADGWWTRRIPSDDDWKTVIEINLMGVVNVSQAVETDMKNRKKGTKERAKVRTKEQKERKDNQYRLYRSPAREYRNTAIQCSQGCCGQLDSVSCAPAGTLPGKRKCNLSWITMDPFI